MAKNISTILNLVDKWTNPMKMAMESTNSFRKVVNEASSTTKLFSERSIGSVKKFENQITHMSNGMTKMGEKAKSVFSSTAGKIALFTGGLGLAAAAKQSISLASGLVEIQNVVDQTFGKSASQINTWSKTALNAFGMSQLQAKQFTGYLGAMMKSSGVTGKSLVKMSEDLTGLAGDMASFDNIPIEEAYEKIRSGISDETEPLKQIGINMDVTNLKAYALAKGIKQPYDKMSQAQQTILRYNYLMSVTADKHGDFAKTSNTFANQVRLATVNLQQLGASLAAYVLPSLNKLLNAFNGGAMKTIGNTFTNAFKSIALVAESTKPILSDLWNSIKQFANASGITTTMKNLFSGVNNDTIYAVERGLYDILWNTKQFVIFCTNHIGTIKVFGSALAGAFVGVNIAKKVFEVKNGMNDIIKAVNGAKKVSKGEALFETIFKMSPRAVLFIGALAGIGALAYIIIKNWSAIKGFFDKFFNQMHGGFILASVGIIGSIQAFKKLGVTFTDLRIAGLYAGDAIKKVGSGIGTGFSKGAGLIQKLGSNLLSVGRNALTAARNIGTFIARSAMTGISKGAGLIRTLGSNMLSVGKNALTSAKNIAIMTGNVAKQGAIFVINAARAVIFKGATLAVAAAQKIAAAAQAVLNFAMNMNPIIRIITVIFTLVGALVVLYNKNVWFRNKVNEIFSWFSTLPAKFKGWAHDMIEGFVQGIKDKIEAVRKGAHNIAETIKKILHFSTPDEGPLRPYQTWMPDFVNGMTTGMASTTPNIWKSTTNMTTGMSNRVKSYVSTCKPMGISIVSQLASGISDSGAESNILSVVKKLTTKVIDAFKNGFGIHSPSRVFFKLGDYIVQGFVNGLNNKDMGGFIKNWVGDMTSMAGGAVGGNITGILTAALGIAGAPMSWLPALEMLTSRESGNPGTLGTGNPSLVNSIGVGNEHATGLLQLLPSTYQDMMGTNAGITNPIQNAVAGIKHIMSAWKSIYNIPGLMTGVGYQGYANGGIATKPSIFGEAGAEIAIPLKNNSRSRQLLGQAENIIGGNAKENSPQINVYLNVQGNMLGNEEYAESLGDYIYKKIVDARRKL